VVAMRFEGMSVEQRRLEMVKAFEAGMCGVDVCRLYDVSRDTLYRWVGRYRAAGEAGLVNRSTRPRSSPGRIPVRLERLIVSYRAAHPRWGPRRIRAELARRDGIERPPAISTIQNVLIRNQLLVAAARTDDGPAPAVQRFERHHANELWQTDTKELGFGWGSPWVAGFLDDASRHCLALEWFWTVRSDDMVTVFDHAVTRVGFPVQVLADRGSIMTGRTTRTVSRFERHLWTHGVITINGRGYHPQTQGKMERLWRTLIEWFADHPIDHPDQLTASLDAFRWHYNHERPHQALPGDITPAERFTALPLAVADPVAARSRNHRTSIRSVAANGVVGYGEWGINVGRAWAHTKVVVTDTGFTITVSAPDGTTIRSVDPDYDTDYYPQPPDPLLTGRPPRH
jgi:transposase InsO family protein